MSNTVASSSQLQIGELEIVEQDDTVQCRFPIHSETEDQNALWFSLDQDYKNLLSNRADAALVALLIPAMADQNDIILEGILSERLYYTLSGPYQDILQTIIPSLDSVSIYPNNIQPSQDRASGVATGFSAGIDSFSVLADHYYSDPPSGFELTHLLYNNVGSHGDGGERLFRERYERLQPVADRVGLPFIAVNSNMGAFYDEFNFQQTHTPRNAAVALLLQGGIGRFFYGSTFDYEEIKVDSIYDMAYSDPVTLPLLSTGGLDALAVGSEYSRVEKTLQVANMGISHNSLDICVRTDSAQNCSNCWKCRRTLLTLEIADLLDRYSTIFDLNTYNQIREFYMGEVLSSDDPLLREIVAFAEAEEFEFPRRSKALAATVWNPATHNSLHDHPKVRNTAYQAIADRWQNKIIPRPLSHR